MFWTTALFAFPMPLPAVRCSGEMVSGEAAKWMGIFVRYGIICSAKGIGNAVS